MKILILGMGRHGKDTAAEYLRDYFNISFTSSSYAAAKHLKPVLDVINGVKTSDEHFEERHSYRELWKSLITLYNTSDKAALCKKILEESDCYVGMRCNEEYKASRELFDVVLYVDASKRVEYQDSTMDIPFNRDEMLLVDNNGCLGGMHFRLAEIMEVGEWGS